jgi:hypothetical protein
MPQDQLAIFAPFNIFQDNPGLALQPDMQTTFASDFVTRVDIDEFPELPQLGNGLGPQVPPLASSLGNQADPSVGSFIVFIPASAAVTLQASVMSSCLQPTTRVTQQLGHGLSIIQCDGYAMFSKF